MPEFCQRPLADAADLQKPVHRLERTVDLPVFDNPPGQSRSDAAEGLQLLLVRGVDVDQSFLGGFRLVLGGDGVVRTRRRFQRKQVQRRQRRQEHRRQQQEKSFGFRKFSSHFTS